MTACTIMRAEPAQAKNGKAGNYALLYRAIGLALFLLLWYLLTLCFPPMVVPTIPQVFRKLLAIIQGKKFLSTVLITILRFLIGLAIGVALGTVLGILFGINRHVEGILSPYISMIQAVPPVCWVVLALVWFGFNGKPCIFIVATASVPAMVLNHYPAQLSGGMAKRCALARAFHYQGKLLLMDEPFQGLDYGLRMEMLAMLLNIWRNEQQSILFVTHEIDEALTVASRIAVLSARPARIRKIIELPGQEGRDCAEPELTEIRRDVLRMISKTD